MSAGIFTSATHPGPNPPLTPQTSLQKASSSLQSERDSNNASYKPYGRLPVK